MFVNITQRCSKYLHSNKTRHVNFDWHLKPNISSHQEIAFPLLYNCIAWASTLSEQYTDTVRGVEMLQSRLGLPVPGCLVCWSTWGQCHSTVRLGCSPGCDQDRCTTSIKATIKHWKCRHLLYSKLLNCCRRYYFCNTYSNITSVLIYYNVLCVHFIVQVNVYIRSVFPPTAPALHDT